MRSTPEKSFPSLDPRPTNKTLRRMLGMTLLISTAVAGTYLLPSTSDDQANKQAAPLPTSGSPLTVELPLPAYRDPVEATPAPPPMPEAKAQPAAFIKTVSLPPKTSSAPPSPQPSLLPVAETTSHVALLTYEETHNAAEETKPEVPEAKPVAPLKTAAVAPQSIVIDEPEERPWSQHTISKGESLAIVFRRAGLQSRELHALVNSSKEAKILNRVRPGKTLFYRKDDDGRLQDFRYVMTELKEFSATRTEKGFDSKIIEHKVERRITHANAMIKDSLYMAGNQAGLSDRLTMEMANIFGWDVDFALDIRKGDSFALVYEEIYKDGEKIGTGNILSASFTNQGKTFSAVRFVDPTGHSSYYTPEGRSMRKAFLRTPVKFARISSRFNLRRRHPILNTIRAHKGVDYAAPTGTPIRATGDGKITFRGRKGGYGKTVIIQHGQKYSTLYAHMSRYSKLRAGKRVKQGQVIGYVGSTGQSTGPHLHYEFRVNGVHRNPLRVKFPQAEPIPKKYRKEFKQQTAPLLAKLESITRIQVASNP